MADVILLGSASIFMLGMLVYTGINIFRARNSRPVRIELLAVNTEKSASTVEIAPYVEEVVGQFSETLDDD